MKNLKAHSEKVEKCLNYVNKEIGKMNFQSKGKKYKDLMERIIIKDAALKFGINANNVRMIYYGKIN